MKYYPLTFILLSLLSIVPSYGLSPADLLKQQLPQGAGNYLKNRVPYLQAGAPIPENNVYSVNLEGPGENYEAFASMTGFSLPQVNVIASWYIFERSGDVPSSLTEILNLVNQKKPAFYGQMALINGSWRAQADLSPKSLRSGSGVFVYFSVVNRSGILVPVGSQSFYYDPIEGVAQREQSAGINLGLVRFWYDRGYFMFNANAIQFE